MRMSTGRIGVRVHCLQYRYMTGADWLQHTTGVYRVLAVMHDWSLLAAVHVRSSLVAEHDRRTLAVVHDWSILAAVHDRSSLAAEHVRSTLAPVPIRRMTAMHGSGSSRLAVVRAKIRLA